MTLTGALTLCEHDGEGIDTVSPSATRIHPSGVKYVVSWKAFRAAKLNVFGGGKKACETSRAGGETSYTALPH